MNDHACPICGRWTSGTPTEGGLTWDICPDCFEAQSRAGGLTPTIDDQTRAIADTEEVLS